MCLKHIFKLIKYFKYENSNDFYLTLVKGLTDKFFEYLVLLFVVNTSCNNLMSN